MSHDEAGAAPPRPRLEPTPDAGAGQSRGSDELSSTWTPTLPMMMGMTRIGDGGGVARRHLGESERRSAKTERPPTERPAAERPSVERPSVERPAAERPAERWSALSGNPDTRRSVEADVVEARDAPSPSRSRARLLSETQPAVRAAERRAVEEAATQQLRGRLEGTPTTLRTERLGDGDVNCLEAGATMAKPGRDELVFMDDLRSAAEGNANGAGHVLVRDRATGRVWDPNDGPAPANPRGWPHRSAEEWANRQTVAAAGAAWPAYAEAGAVPAERVQALLALPSEERAARIDADPALAAVADRLVADAPVGSPEQTGPSEIDPARRAAIDAFVQEHRDSRFPGEETVEALRGRSHLGELSAPEQRLLVERTTDLWQENEDTLRLAHGTNRIVHAAREDRTLAAPVADAFAGRAVAAARDPDDPLSRLAGATLATAAVTAAGDPEIRRAMLDRLGSDAPGLITALRPDDQRLGGLGHTFPDERAEAVGSLLEAAALGPATAASEALTQAAFEQLPASAYERQRALPEQMGAALAAHWHPGDTTARRAEAARFAGILETSQGRELLAGNDVPLAARAEALQVLRANPELDGARLRAHGGSGWTHPEVTRPLAAARAQDFLELRGDAPAALPGSHLDNTVGFAMGLAPHVPEGESTAARDAREAAIAAGEHSLYAEGEAAALVQPVADAIRRVGGQSAEVTVLPIQYSSERTGPVQLPLFRVRDAETGADRFVDNTGRTYRDFEDWRRNNQLPPGNMVYPAGGHLAAGSDGEVRLGSANTPRTVDTFGELALQVLDGAALVGGVVAGGAIIFGSGGTAAPLVLGGASLYGAGRSAASLYDRATHGQTLSLADPGARSDWLSLGANALGFGAVGATAAAGRLARVGHAASPLVASTAAALNVGAFVADGAAIANSGHTLLTQWDQLSGAERAQIGLSMAFWGGAALSRTRLANVRPQDAFDFTRLREGMLHQGRRATPLNPHPTNHAPGGPVSQNFAPTAQHMFTPGTIGQRSRGINGAHRPADFQAALAGQGQVVGARDVPGFPGVQVVDYRMYQATPQGQITTNLGGRTHQKTLFDPAIWSQRDVERLMRDVFGDAVGSGTFTRNVNGVEFIGWVRNGQLDSFGINVPPP